MPTSDRKRENVITQQVANSSSRDSYERVILTSGYRVRVLRWTTSAGTQLPTGVGATHFFAMLEDGTGTTLFLPKSYIYDPTQKQKVSKKQ